jgi:NADH-quinone oxidoreductase subunit H
MIDLIDAAIIVIKALFVLVFGLSMMPLLVFLERKVSAFMQDRPGPNRANIGPIRLAGLVHLLADAVKMLSKEQIIPRDARVFYYLLAPCLTVALACMVLPMVPFADAIRLGDRTISMQVVDINVGLLWYFAVASLMVYGVVLAGWASNSKYSLLGGIRSSAQMISYELPLGLSVIGLLMVFGTTHLNELVTQQGELLFGFIPKWGLVVQPLAAIIFIICSFAETNRAPFDLAEGESELVGGFHTEYSGMLFGMFFLGEYIAMVVASAMIVTLFFGGWQIPFLPTEALIANAGILSQVSAGLAALAAFAIAVVFYRYNQREKGHFNDIRDKEGMVYAVVAALAGLGALATLAVLVMFGMPEWAAPLFAALAQMGMFIGKVMLFCVFFIWVRWTLPRFRYDQLMFLGWRSLLPLALANIFITGVVILLTGGLAA